MSGRQHTGHPRRWLRTTAALLPLALAAPAAPAPGPASAPWAGTWMSTTTGTTGTRLADVRAVIGASTGKAATLTGAGVGVAMIDTGVAPVPGLPPARLVNGPDLSFESQDADLRYLDTYGHGTHLAGIIVGNDTASGTVGLAPQAKLTSLKLGTATGAVDVTQVIAAVDWVVQHKDDDRNNPIRVLNLAYGSGGTPTAANDPLQFAVERAWLNGIVVVTSAGNAGNGSASLTNPAMDPYVISVGAAATKGTLTTADDDVSAFTNLAGTGKQPDLLAPGESIVSLRDPGSFIDVTYPGARVGETLFRGSGTSQAAAVTSAAVALLLQSRPTLTPDQVKSVLKQGTALTAGKAGSLKLTELNLTAALGATPPKTAAQYWKQSSGTGVLDGARGKSRVVDGSVSLSGERTIFGAFKSAPWAVAAMKRTAWSGGVWMGVRMAGDGWTGTSFASRTWAPATWSGGPWAGGSWIDPAWQGRFWAGRFWAAGSWQGRFWASEDWSTAHWG